MADLRIDLATSLVHGVCDIFPALDMLVVPDARSVGPFSAASHSVRIDNIKVRGRVELSTLGARSERLQ